MFFLLLIHELKHNFSCSTVLAWSFFLKIFNFHTRVFLINFKESQLLHPVHVNISRIHQISKLRNIQLLSNHLFDTGLKIGDPLSFRAFLKFYQPAFINSANSLLKGLHTPEILNFLWKDLHYLKKHLNKLTSRSYLHGVLLQSKLWIALESKQKTSIQMSITWFNRILVN